MSNEKDTNTEITATERTPPETQERPLPRTEVIEVVLVDGAPRPGDMVSPTELDALPFQLKGWALKGEPLRVSCMLGG